MTGSGDVVSAPLMSTIADAGDTTLFLRRRRRILEGLLDGTVGGCPHLGSSEAIWAFADGASAYCRACWPRVPPVPLAERRCDMCGAGQAIGWMTSSEAGRPFVLVAAVCDACEISRVAGEAETAAREVQPASDPAVTFEVIRDAIALVRCCAAGDDMGVLAIANGTPEPRHVAAFLAAVTVAACRRGGMDDSAITSMLAELTTVAQDGALDQLRHERGAQGVMPDA